MKKSMLKAAQSAVALSLGIALAGCGGMANNPTLESIHQPIVQRTNYTLDLATGPGGLSLPEQRRLSGWFEAMELRYGDRISIDDPQSSGATRSAVEAVASRYGLLVSDDAPTTPGYVNSGAARVVITRAKATVPGCPDWATKTDANPLNATASGYGCAINGNLAAMIANPEHLVNGAASTSATTIMSSTKAIDTYRAATPTGASGLKQTSSSGK